MKRVMLKEFNGITAYDKAYETTRHQFKDMEMICAKCGGNLIVSPYVTDAYFDKGGILHFGLDSINYCKNCWG